MLNLSELNTRKREEWLKLCVFLVFNKVTDLKEMTMLQEIDSWREEYLFNLKVLIKFKTH